ncbi:MULTISPECIES: DUF4396 domain-containing protein [Citromicrobium]|uniref:DUF4396 domain-containing protein n=1 Tax=Citromicrobium TaxID=72173 RepID=UPI0001DD08D0|nr:MULTISPECIES: DUF4396 domain-containing protein [Citromicrobium]ALG61685.1 membrane protein [Citromicrobium sp. JL477]KPM12868.1 membrane protein [Citromicrobium sp. JL1351]KPM21103.1 membrane protein [Citromicrobium sp. JL31]KPM27088.1 membrane protein [Citromicrobium sp. JL2201]
MHAPTFPDWLHALSTISLLIAAACALWIAIDVIRHPQKMAVMNFVWPLAALFGSVLWVALYFAFGRRKGRGIDAPQEELPFWASVAKGASHCGAGCTLGDIIAEWSAFAFPQVAVWFGWHTLFGEKIFAVWIVDYIVAFVLGLAFQYFTIKPMRDVSVGEGIAAAVKADFLSITSWQVGMYGLMALIQFAWFAPSYGGLAPVNTPEFWFAMQIAMLAGFATAFPTNWWLIRKGLKEKM